MKTQKLLWFILITTDCGCIKDINHDNVINSPVNSTSDSLMHFIVETIQNLPLEEFKARIDVCDYPLEININQQDSAYLGSVLFENLGEKKIDRNCGGQENCFIIETDSVFEFVNFIAFSDLEFTDSSLTGQYACEHPLADYPSHLFRARKK